jgi:hypothetical protein
MTYMTTPTHVIADLAVFLILLQVKVVDPNYTDLALIIGSNLIDVDHLFSQPIYHPNRNPFTAHFLHKRWMLLITFSIILIFIRPLMFLGIGLLVHVFLDYIYVRRIKSV